MESGYIMFSVTMMLILSGGTLIATVSVWRMFKKFLKKGKLKKLDLNKYDIVCDKNGFPSILIGIENKNDIVYI